MAKQQPNIRWRKRDTDELQRLINNFNAKIYRVSKNHPELTDILPERVNRGDLTKSIQTREDFNRVTASLERFTKRGMETPVKSSRGATTTKWAVKEFNDKQELINKEREKRLKELGKKDLLSRGKKTGSKRSEMGTIKENSLKPSKKNFNSMSQTEWEKAKQNIEFALDPLQTELSKHNMRLNYIKGLRTLGYSEDIVANVLKLDIDKFIEITQTDTEAEFDFIYDPVEFEIKQDALREVWENAVNTD